MGSLVHGNHAWVLAAIRAKIHRSKIANQSAPGETRIPITKENDMASKVDVYKAYVEASWANPPSSIAEASMTYLSDDFKNFDKDGNVIMDRAAYTGMGQLLGSAFTDFKAVYSDVREEGDSVIATYHFEGTHTGDLDLSAMGLGIIPASGKKIVWPDDTAAFKIRGDKIASIKPYGDSAGIEAFLAPLGVKLPSE
jgi:predicted ester cyclase